MFNFFARDTISENGIGSYELLILVLGKLSNHRRNNGLVIIDGLRKLGSTKSRSVLPVSRRSRGNVHENKATDFIGYLYGGKEELLVALFDARGATIQSSEVN